MRDSSELSVFFAIDSCDEIDCVRIEPWTCPGGKSPKAAIDDRLTVAAHHRTHERSCIRIERIDLAVTEVPDEQIVGERSPACRCYNDAPGLIELPSSVDETSLEDAVCIEYADN